MELRQDITILPADDPRRLRLGFVIKEYQSEEDYQRDLLDTEGQDALNAYLHESNPKRREETDISDRYIGTGKAWTPQKRTSFHNVEVFPELKGKPYNNGTLNLLTACRPSVVRVIPHNGSHHLDAMQWRVTIYLDENNMISHIWQEAEVGLYGKRFYDQR